MHTCEEIYMTVTTETEAELFVRFAPGRLSARWVRRAPGVYLCLITRV